MRVKIAVLTLGVAVFALAVAGCGPRKEPTLKDRALSNMGDDVDPVSHLVGDVASTPVEQTQAEKPSEATTEPAKADDQDVIGGTQGAFLATLTVLGQTAEGTFRVLTATADPQVVKEGLKTGEDAMLDPGTYDFEFTTAAVAGGGKKTLEGVEIVAGRRVKREIKYPAGKLTLVTGAKCAKAPIRIKEKGAEDWLPGKFFTCQEIILPAGYYEAERGSTPISGIQVYDGGIQQVMIRPK
jgi:hypothetical protein